MVHQSPLGCKTFPTIFANVRPLTSVSSLVFFNNTIVNRAKVTMIAFELFFGRLTVKIGHVILELCFVWKSYSTLLTDHRIQHMLVPLVAVKTVTVVISLWTLITLENPFFLMNFVNMVSFIKLISKVAEMINNLEESIKSKINIYYTFHSHRSRKIGF